MGGLQLGYVILVLIFTKVDQLMSRPGVSNLRPAGRTWPSKPFYVARRMIWELANAGRAKNLCCRVTLI
jgi:hypothetical protein